MQLLRELPEILLGGVSQIQRVQVFNNTLWLTKQGVDIWQTLEICPVTDYIRFKEELGTLQQPICLQDLAPACNDLIAAMHDNPREKIQQRRARVANSRQFSNLRGKVSAIHRTFAEITEALRGIQGALDAVDLGNGKAAFAPPCTGGSGANTGVESDGEQELSDSDFTEFLAAPQAQIAPAKTKVRAAPAPKAQGSEKKKRAMCPASRPSTSAKAAQAEILEDSVGEGQCKPDRTTCNGDCGPLKKRKG